MYEANGVELAAVFQQAKATGVTTSMDMALPDPTSPGGQVNWRAILQRTLPTVDIFLPSIEEILYMLRRELYEDVKQEEIIEAVTPTLLVSLSDELLAMGVKMLVIKLGYRGLFLRTAAASRLEQMGRAGLQQPEQWANKTLWTSCFAVDVVGTTGAGDATIAGFLSALLRDQSAEEALTMAVAVGACNVEAADALSGLQSWPATQERVAQGWARLPLDLSAYGWQQEARFSLWKPGE
jgi:sugar/nucleoside kinase (ribokinase family)